MIKKTYEEPLAKLVKLRSAMLIGASTTGLTSVKMSPDSEMDEGEVFE